MEKEGEPESQLRKRLDDFEPGCRLSLRNLHDAMERTKRKFDRSNGIYNRLDARISSQTVVLIQHLIDGCGLMKYHNQTGMADNSEVFAAFEKIGTPEALAYLRTLRCLKPALTENLSKTRSSRNPFGNSNIKLMHDATARATREDDPGLTYGLVVWMQLLKDGRFGHFTPETREELLSRCAAVEALYQDSIAMAKRIDGVVELLNPLFDTLDDLELMVRLYGRRDVAMGRVQNARLAAEELDTAPPPEERSPELPSPLETRLRRLEDEQETVKNEIRPKEAVLKEHFASRPDLIAPVSGVLKEIQFLCRDIVKFRIDDVTAWEIGIASQRWPAMIEKVPKGNALSALTRSAVEEALGFLTEHEDFLASYNIVRTGRERIDSISVEIQKIKDELAKPAKVLKTMSGMEEQLRRKNRLARTVKEVELEIEQLGEELTRKLSKFGDPKAPEEFWRDVWVNVNDRRIEPATKELDRIDVTLNGLRERLKKNDSGNTDDSENDG